MKLQSLVVFVAVLGAVSHAGCDGESGVDAGEAGADSGPGGANDAGLTPDAGEPMDSGTDPVDGGAPDSGAFCSEQGLTGYPCGSSADCTSLDTLGILHECLEGNCFPVENCTQDADCLGDGGSLQKCSGVVVGHCANACETDQDCSGSGIYGGASCSLDGACEPLGCPSDNFCSALINDTRCSMDGDGTSTCRLTCGD